MFDLGELSLLVQRHGRIARVVIAALEGSSPREVGTAMLVWPGGQSGTIGGGALEWQATQRAQALLASGCPLRLDRVPLGPSLGQCCGGAVTVLTEVFDISTLPQADEGIFARSIDGRGMPLAIKRVLDRARSQGVRPCAQLLQGWFVEPMAVPRRHLWLWGAGHVGRAVAAVMAPLPDLSLTWVDIAESRFPADPPAGVTLRASADPADLVTEAQTDAEHLILTFSHALDLELCHRLLRHGFARCGLIGSATKWARFRSRLSALGHAPVQIERIDCPIGDPSLGKHPQAIAVGIAAAFLQRRHSGITRQETAG